MGIKHKTIMTTTTISLPFTAQAISTLQAGQKLLLSGSLLTARDAAHKRMCECLQAGKPLPFDITQYPIYYCGPTPARQGSPIGACGPTTSGRMDTYTKALMCKGLRVMIGKGNRSAEVQALIKHHAGLYLVAIGGAGALYGSCVTASRCVAWEDLGTEAVYELQVRDFPVYVGIDTQGNDIYEGRQICE